MENKLIPENDMQEHWERAGRQYAAMDYMKTERFPDVKVIYVMLGGDPEDLAWKENDK